MEALKQPQHSPYPLEQQTALLYLVINGHLASIGETSAVSIKQEGELRDVGESLASTSRRRLERLPPVRLPAASCGVLNPSARINTNTF